MTVPGRILLVLLVLGSLTGPARAGELDPEALGTARRGYTLCVERLGALQAVRNPLCVALVRADPSMCTRVQETVRPICRVLARSRRWLGILLRPFQRIPRGGDPLIRRCPATLPPGAVLDDASCRRVLLSHILLPNGGEGATVLVKMVNPFDEVARCDLRLRATHGAHDPEEHAAVLVLPPRSPLDRRIPIRYDADTRVEVEVSCSWSL